MDKLFEKIEKLKRDRNIQYCMDEKIVQEIYKEYSNIPFDIIQYFFVRHSNQFKQILSGINSLNAKEITITNKYLTKNDLLNKETIDHAPFAINSEHDIPENCKNEYYKILKDEFPSGTWNHPIITVFQNNKYLVLDGNNRFARLKMAIKCDFDFVENTHEIYVLN